MKFMMMVRASRDTEAGAVPGTEFRTAMIRYNEELMKAGVLLDLAGLQPSSAGVRIRYSGGTRTIIDGPFESGEVIAGYWIIQVKSRDEAIEWARRVPAPQGGREGEIEVRPFFDIYQ